MIEILDDTKDSLRHHWRVWLIKLMSEHLLHLEPICQSVMNLGRWSVEDILNLDRFCQSWWAIQSHVRRRRQPLTVSSSLVSGFLPSHQCFASHGDDAHLRKQQSNFAILRKNTSTAICVFCSKTAPCNLGTLLLLFLGSETNNQSDHWSCFRLFLEECWFPFSAEL